MMPAVCSSDIAPEAHEAKQEPDEEFNASNFNGENCIEAHYPAIFTLSAIVLTLFISPNLIPKGFQKFRIILTNAVPCVIMKKMNIVTF